jgi:hypothetical protein
MLTTNDITPSVSLLVYQMGIKGSYPEGKAAYLHLVMRLRMHDTTPPLPQHVFMAWCLIKQI